VIAILPFELREADKIVEKRAIEMKKHIRITARLLEAYSGCHTSEAAEQDD
jgi:hypothetical protein